MSIFSEKLQEKLVLCSLSEPEIINFSKVESKIILGEPSSSSNKWDLSCFYISNIRDEKGKKPYIISLKRSGQNNVEIDQLELSKIPQTIIRSFTACYQYGLTTNFQVLRSFPLLCFDLTRFGMTEENIIFQFMDTAHEPFELLDEKVENLKFSGTNANAVADIYWNVNKYDSSVLPRVKPEIVYIENEESFIVFGGFVPTKYLPDKYIDFFCRQILIETTDTGRKRALGLLKKTYYPTDDIWKFHIKDKRWEMISDVTYSPHSTDPSEWCKNVLRSYDPFFCSFACPEQKKVYFLTRKLQTSGKAEFLVYDCTTNKVRRVGDFDLGLFSDFRNGQQCVDDSTKAVIFCPKKLDKLLVICLETFKSTEIKLDLKLPLCSEKLSFRYELLDSGRKLVVVATLKFITQNEGDTALVSYLYGSLDWERVRREKIIPFIEQARR